MSKCAATNVGTCAEPSRPAMAPEVLLPLLFALFSLPLVFLLRQKRFPALPWPRLSEYLPLLESKNTNRTLNALAEKYGDLFQLYLGTMHVVASAVPEDVAQILSKQSLFPRADRQLHVFNTIFPGGLPSLKGEDHHQARVRIRESFNHSFLDGFHGTIVDAAVELCEKLNKVAVTAPKGGWSDRVDISSLLAVATSRVMSSIAFGFKMEADEGKHVKEVTEQLLDEMLKDYIGYPFRQALTPFGVRNNMLETQTAIQTLCKRLVQKRMQESEEERRDRPPDLFDSLVSLGEGDAKRIISHTIVFLIAGSHTTSQALSWCLYETCCHPAVMKKIESEISDRFSERPLNEFVSAEDVGDIPYISKVCKESDRLHGLIPFHVRKAEKDCTLQGSKTRVRKGQHVLALTHRVQTHPGVWRDAEAFIPERWGTAAEPGEADKTPPGSYAPFSLGPANCPGQFLANHEAAFFLVEIHRRFKFKLACDPDEVVSCTMSVENPRSPSVPGGKLDKGIQVKLQLR